MKILVDTCGWIEWLTDGKLVKSFSPYFQKIEKLIVPTQVQYELYKWITREKNSTLALEVIGVTERAVVVSLETSLALYAADLAAEYQLAMADAVIYASALRSNAVLITSDSHFQKLPQVEFFAK